MTWHTALYILIGGLMLAAVAGLGWCMFYIILHLGGLEPWVVMRNVFYKDY